MTRLESSSFIINLDLAGQEVDSLRRFGARLDEAIQSALAPVPTA